MMAIALDEHLEQPKTLVLRGRRTPWRRRRLSREYIPDTLLLAIPDGVPGVPPLLDKPRARARSTDGCAGALAASSRVTI